MFLQADIKCNKESTPYRIYINDELMTERFYTIPIGYTPDQVKNILNIELPDASDYKVTIENIPDHPDSNEPIWIADVRWQAVTYNPSMWDQIEDPVAAGLKGEALEAYRKKYGTRKV